MCWVWLLASVGLGSGYLVHAAHHRFALLWEFHKVHHTAEVLTPFSVHRKHPLYDVVAYAGRGVLAGLLQEAAAYAFIGRPGFVTVLGINAVYAVFRAAGSNLRHTHACSPSARGSAGYSSVPRNRESICFGIKDAVSQEHPSLRAAYTVPLRNVARSLAEKRRS